MSLATEKGGLKCPACGTHLNNVVDTRAVKDKILRRRRCFNGHLFSTEEKIPRVFATRRRELTKEKAKAKKELHAKALALVEAQRNLPQRSRLSMRQVASKVGISVETLYRVIKRAKAQKET